MTVNTVSEVQTTQKEPERERRIVTSKATQLVWLLLSIFEAWLALRFVLKLVRGPNRPARLPRFFMVYRLFAAADVPVLIGTPAAGGMVLEVSILIAMLVYGLIAWAVERIIFVIFYRPRGPG